MIAIIDYDAGNLHSVKNALDFLGADSVITRDENVIKSSEKIILPGVGAFADGMSMLRKYSLDKILRNEVSKGKNLLGICLGMQLLFEKSFEKKECEGLGFIKGEINKIEAPGMKIPHMGWNDIFLTNKSPLLENVKSGEFVYFVHSYMAYTEDKYINAYCDYNGKIPAAVSRGNVYGCQFHPEKSDKTGLEILKNFINTEN